MAQTRRVPVVVLPESVMDWGGMKLHRTASLDYFESKTAPFRYEVDASLDDDDEYEARVSFRGVKIVAGRGNTRQAALTKALQELKILELNIGAETAARREDMDARKKRTDRGA